MAVGTGRKAGFGTHSRAPFSEFSRRQDVGSRALTKLFMNLTFTTRLRGGYGHDRFTHKPVRMDRRPVLPSHGSLPSSWPSLGAVTVPAALSHQGLFSQSRLSFLDAPQRHALREMTAESACPKPVGTSHVSKAKFTDASKAGSGGGGVGGVGPVCLYLGAAFLLAPGPNNKAGMCASRGRCYGDFINNIIFSIPVP